LPISLFFYPIVNFLVIFIFILITNYNVIHFIMTYESIFSARTVNIWNSLPNSIVDACTVNAFEARLDKLCFGSTN